MKTVHLIETFDDLCNAFNGVRVGGDKTPMIEKNTVLHCNFGDLELKGVKSELFVIADELKPKAKLFLEFLMTTDRCFPASRLLIDEKFES